MRALLCDVWDGIRSQPARAGLSFIAIAIGSAALTILVAVLEGLDEKAQRMVQQLGADVIAILQQHSSKEQVAVRLEDKHATLLAANLVNAGVSTLRVSRVATRGTIQSLSVIETDSELMRIRRWMLKAGRFLDEWDLHHRERNVVISQSLSQLWNWKVGDIILLERIPFRIVGIVAMGGDAVESEIGNPGLLLGERAVFIPKTVHQYWETDPDSLNSGVDAIFIQVPQHVPLSKIVAGGQRLLTQPGYTIGNVSWVTPDTLIREIRNLQRIIGFTAGSIAGLCLVLGGTTLLSLMIANVRERVTEIGLRQALGASRREIASLFVFEACCVTGSAAAAATVGTHLLMGLGRKSIPVQLSLGWASIFIPFTVAVILGMVFSYWPAMSAAKIMPSDALRNE